jgi:DNA-binding FadR family transcriptional regulator
VARDAQNNTVSGEPKAGERLAQQIVDEIAAAGWNVGAMLGTESDLIARYGVSRNAFREAVRLLEHLNAARMREGRSGGLVVTEPQPEPVRHAAAILLRYEGVQAAELYDARLSLELDIVRRAIEQLDDAGEARLREAVREERGTDAVGIRGHTRTLHMTLAELGGNRPMALFLDTLISLSDEYSRPELVRPGPELEAAVRASQRAHQAIARAVIARDVETATHRMRAHLTAVQRWMPPGG